MAEINKKLVKYATEAKFVEDLAGVADKINPKSVVFIEDTGRIWTHGKYYDGAWAGISGKPTTFAPAAHTHGPITNDGKIGTSADRIIETTTGGALTPVAKNTAYNKAFGTGSSQVARGNHTHKHITATRYDTGDPKPNELVQGLSFQFSYPDGGWHNAINMRSYSDPNYLSTQIVSSANNPGRDTGYSYSLRYREGRNETWLGWKTIYDSSNLLNFNRTVAGLVPAPGAATTTRYLREDGGWFVPPNTADTHWTTGIRAGASETTTNAPATNPYIKVLDDSTYRSQIRLSGSGATSVSSDASGNITISSIDSNTIYTHPTSDGNKHVPATGTTSNGKVLKAGATAGSMSWGTLNYSDVGAASHEDLNAKIDANKFQVVTALPTFPTAGVFYFVKE